MQNSHSQPTLSVGGNLDQVVNSRALIGRSVIGQSIQGITTGLRRLHATSERLAEPSDYQG